MPGENRVGFDDGGDFLQGLLAQLLADVGQRLAFAIRQPHATCDLVAQDAIFCHQILVTQQQFLIDGSRDIGQQVCRSKEAPCCLSTAGFIPAPTRTGRARFRAPSVPIRLPYGIFALATFEERYDSILLSVPLSLCPVCLDPFALCRLLSDSLGGRHSTDYCGSAAPVKALATCPPIPDGKLLQVPALLA